MNQGDSIVPLGSEKPPAVVLQGEIEKTLVNELLKKALQRLEDLLDAEDDALVQKTAVYLVDLAKEVAGFRGKEPSGRTAGVNIAVFSPQYLTKLATEAQKVVDAEVIEVVEED